MEKRRLGWLQPKWKRDYQPEMLPKRPWKQSKGEEDKGEEDKGEEDTNKDMDGDDEIR